MEAIAPQVVFFLFGLPITDTVVSTWVMMAISHHRCGTHQKIRASCW